MIIRQKPVLSESLSLKDSGRPSMADQIRKQIDQLQKQLDKVKESKEPSQTKTDRIKELNEQIRQLQQHLQQAAVDEKRKEVQEQAAKAADKAQQEAAKYKDEEQLRMARESVNLFAVTGKFSEMKVMRKVQTDMIARKNYTGAARITGSIMQKSMEIQEALKRGAERKPEELRQKRDSRPDGDAAVQPEQRTTAASATEGRPEEEPGRAGEKKPAASVDIRA